MELHIFGWYISFMAYLQDLHALLQLGELVSGLPIDTCLLYFELLHELYDLILLFYKKIETLVACSMVVIAYAPINYDNLVKFLT